jgi:hypothetical protein
MVLQMLVARKAGAKAAFCTMPTFYVFEKKGELWQSPIVEHP